VGALAREYPSIPDKTDPDDARSLGYKQPFGYRNKNGEYVYMLAE